MYRSGNLYMLECIGKYFYGWFVFIFLVIIIMLERLWEYELIMSFRNIFVILGVILNVYWFVNW